MQLRINPLLNKELRIRMRTWRTFALVSLYLLGLGGFSLLYFAGSFFGVEAGYTTLASVGQGMFSFLSVLQLVLVVFLVPALTGNAISGERERQTFDLLACTQLSPWGIVLGKLAAALSAVVLLIIASLPLYGFVFLMGGVSPVQLLILFAILLVTAFFSGCWALMFSSLLRRTVTSILASYALTLFIFGGTVILSVLIMALAGGQSSIVSHLLLLFNPLNFFEWLYPDALESTLSSLMYNYPFSWTWLKFWHLSLLVNIAFAGLCLWISTRAVNPLLGKKRRG